MSARRSRSGSEAVRARRRRRGGDLTGWLFISPAVIVLAVFLLLPVLMAAWVSVSDWSGVGSPLSGAVNFVGADNYAELVEGGLATRDFGIALRNNLWYVLLVVPTQTLLSLFLAVLVNQRIMARGVFRTAFYFPSVTSSVAITVLWLFLFSASGAVNRILSYLGVHGPNWFHDPTGIVAAFLGLFSVDGSRTLTGQFLGVTAWEWLSGPSFAMTAFIVMAVFTTSGTFMLIFLSALQSLSPSVDEAAMIDGANTWTRFWRVTVPSSSRPSSPSSRSASSAAGRYSTRSTRARRATPARPRSHPHICHIRRPSPIRSGAAAPRSPSYCSRSSSCSRCCSAGCCATRTRPGRGGSSAVGCGSPAAMHRESCADPLPAPSSRRHADERHRPLR